MALLPDLGVAGGIALVAFLLTLGVLVVFLESVPRRLVLGILVAGLASAVALALLGELGIGVVVLGFAAAFVANDVFEWLTTR